ncbi:cyclic nucleotide-binding domain-containing protein [Chlamydia vaughanii]|uniref:cyclic nucleotide-binding domain-containing protein n=1 Tax=Chlamydia vaughanii TaxID=3112552 RepID=UPI0032B1E766
MNLIDRAFLLKKNPIFTSLDMDVLLAISDKTEIMIFKPGAKIFSIEQPSFSLYIIAEGYVKITDSSSLSVTISSHECFGEESLFSNKLREYNAEAITQVRTLILSKGQFLSIVEECPSVALSLLELYAKQITFRYPASLNT